MTAWKLTNQLSCAGCKFLLYEDEGYSNWTVENTNIDCAIERNPNLPQSTPYDWKFDSDGKDNWSATNTSRCERYEYLGSGNQAHFDVDREHKLIDQGVDAEVHDALYDRGYR